MGRDLWTQQIEAGRGLRGEWEELQCSEGCRLHVSDLSKTSGLKQPSFAYKYAVWQGSAVKGLLCSMQHQSGQLARGPSSQRARSHSWHLSGGGQSAVSWGWGVGALSFSPRSPLHGPGVLSWMVAHSKGKLHERERQAETVGLQWPSIDSAVLCSLKPLERPVVFKGRGRTLHLFMRQCQGSGSPYGKGNIAVGCTGLNGVSTSPRPRHPPI